MNLHLYIGLSDMDEIREEIIISEEMYKKYIDEEIIISTKELAMYGSTATNRKEMSWE